MDAMTVVYVFLALITKHFICDFPLQTAYQYKNKGTYGHPGGIVHAAISAAGTLIALVVVLGYSSFFWWIILGEAVIHYHVDWAKMNLNNKWGLGPLTSEQFWWLLGFDQWVHYLTYVAILVTLLVHNAGVI